MLNRINIPKEITQHRQAWLWKGVYRRLHQKNLMWSMIVCGSPGSGKSYLAASVAYLLDRTPDGKPRFSTDKIFFNATDFSAWIAEPHDKGEFCVLDDAGLALASRESMTKALRQICKTFQSCRFLNLGIILSVPHFNMIDVQIRSLINCYAEPVSINYEKELSIAKFHRLETSPRDGKIYHHRPERVSWITHPDGYPMRQVKVLNSLAFDKPPEWLCKSYEEKKRMYLTEWNKRNAKVISEAENPEKKEKGKGFAEYFALVNADKKRFAKPGKNFLQIDAAKIMLAFPTCGVRNAELISRSLNTQLKAVRNKKTTRKSLLTS